MNFPPKNRKIALPFDSDLLPVVALLAAAAFLYFFTHARLGPAILLGVAIALLLLKKLFPVLHRHTFAAINTTAHTIAAFLSLLISTITYFMILTPIALILSLTGRDPLNIRTSSQKKNYWHVPGHRLYDDDFFKEQF